MIRKPLTASAAFTLLGHSSPSFPQTPQSLNLDEQVIRATRAERSFSSIASSTVITQEEIERSQAPSLPDLLRKLAGVSVASKGGRGITSSVYSRFDTERDTLAALFMGRRAWAIQRYEARV